MSRLIGIDLGTTNCCVAVLQGGAPTIVPTRQGQRTMPSVVAFSTARTELVGVTAQRQAATNPERTLFGIKRLIGRKMDEPVIQRWAEMIPYKLVTAPNGDAWVRTPEGDYSPQELSAILLQEIRSCAEEFLGETVTEAVVTVPAYFTESQRQATKDAGRIAGLDIRHILNEPTAAALGYGYKKKDDCRLAIFDLGGGTFDITILKVSNGVFEVLATNGDTFLGGNDFDRRIVEHLADTFQKDNGVDLLEDPVALQRLTEAAEAAKHDLSSTPSTVVSLPFISAKDGPLHLNIDSFDRSLFDRLTADLVDRLEAPARAAMADAGVQPEELESVLLVGGMTRVHSVRTKVEDIFGKIVAKDVNPDEIVAVGAGTQCAIMSGELADVILLDVTPHSLGVKVREGKMSRVIERNTTIPTSASKTFTTTQDGQDFVDIWVYQGEEPLVDGNAYLGQFTLSDLPRRTAGEVKVEVTFLLDADGVLAVSAREVETGKEARVRIEPSSGLTKEQVGDITEARKAS